VLKALARYNSTDFDADYKLPKIMKNYKGTVSNNNVIEHCNIAAYSSVGRPIPVSAERNSFRYRSSEANASSSSTTLSAKLFGEIDESPSPPPSSLKNGSFTTASASRASTSATSSSSSFSAPSPASSSLPYPVNPEWNKKWKQFLPNSNVNVVHTSVTQKSNPMGMKNTRQLILTDEPNIIYADASSMTLKGNIPWDLSKPPKPVAVCCLCSCNFCFLIFLSLFLFLFSLSFSFFLSCLSCSASLYLSRLINKRLQSKHQVELISLWILSKMLLYGFNVSMLSFNILPLGSNSHRGDWIWMFKTFPCCYLVCFLFCFVSYYVLV
jgi:hypothetical protein